MSNVSVETAGGASLGMPPGVRCVNYVNPHDSVANLLGQGHPSLKDVVELDAAAGAAAAELPFVAVSTGEYLLAKPAITQPNGPVVMVPPVTPLSGPLGDLLANHAMTNYLPHRQPFEATYSNWAAQRHTGLHAADASAVAAPAARAAETAYASQIASGSQASSISQLLSLKVAEMQAAGGASLPAPREIVPWGHTATYGSLVALDDRTLAQHTGRGTYQIFDIGRDLHDIAPALGVPLGLSAAGFPSLPAQAIEHTRVSDVR